MAVPNATGERNVSGKDCMKLEPPRQETSSRRSFVAASLPGRIGPGMKLRGAKDEAILDLEGKMFKNIQV
jgi:hypothetical protein